MSCRTQEYNSIVRLGFLGRRHFDGGRYSEPLMLARALHDYEGVDSKSRAAWCHPGSVLPVAGLTADLLVTCQIWRFRVYYESLRVILDSRILARVNSHVTTPHSAIKRYPRKCVSIQVALRIHVNER